MKKKQEVVKTNMYRVLEPCNNCPFMDDGKKIHLNKGRVDSIKEDLLKHQDNSFTCHKTVYNLDIDMNEITDYKQERKMCAGAFLYLKSIKKPNTMMILAQRIGLENWEN